jgi:hypothetical protein
MHSLSLQSIRNWTDPSSCSCLSSVWIMMLWDNTTDEAIRKKSSKRSKQEPTTVNYRNRGKAEKDKKTKERQYINKWKACKEVRGQLDQLNNNTIAELAAFKLIEKNVKMGGRPFFPRIDCKENWWERKLK